VRRGALFVAAQSVLFVLIAVAPRMRHSDWSLGVRVAGALLAVGGLLVVVWGIRALGPAMTAMPEPRADAPLATRGPYRAVRHPIYTGVVALALGVSLARQTAAGLVLTVALAVLFDQKARYEERLLARDPAYAAYRARTRKRFLPAIY
jgi:protein-S-isoprenylcysteine O-methyltransferase Ste14